MHVFTFNTGRLYTTFGQVITVKQQGNDVLFFDHSRGIAGVIPNLTLRQSHEVAATDVMYHYDRHQYRMSVEAMALQRSDTILNIRIK